MAPLGRPQRLLDIAEPSGFPVDRGEPPGSKAQTGITQDEDAQEAARAAFSDWEERLRTVAVSSDRASDALEPGGTWNAYVRAIAGFMSGVALAQISASDYLAYDNTATGRNWHLPLGYGTLVANANRSEATTFPTKARMPAGDVRGIARRIVWDVGTHAWMRGGH